jgi:hypothetical protein
MSCLTTTSASSKARAVVADVPEFVVEFVDVDDRLRRGEAELHERDQAMTPRQKMSLRAMPLQEGNGFVNGSRDLVVETRRYLHTLSSPRKPSLCYISGFPTQHSRNEYSKRCIFMRGRFGSRERHVLEARARRRRQRVRRKSVVRESGSTREEQVESPPTPEAELRRSGAAPDSPLCYDT